MNTFQLTCFLAVAETLNFARAEVTEAELQREKLVLLDPTIPQPGVLRPSSRIMGDRPLADLYFCQTTEAVFALVLA